MFYSKSFQDDPIRKTISFARTSERLPCIRLTSAQPENLPLGFRHLQAGHNADLSTEGGLAAGTLQFVGHNRGVPDSVSGRPKRPRMLATRNGFPIKKNIFIIG